MTKTKLRKFAVTATQVVEVIVNAVDEEDAIQQAQEGNGKIVSRGAAIVDDEAVAIRL